MVDRIASKNKRGRVYPFWSVCDGAVWIAESTREAESIQTCFRDYCIRTKTEMICTRRAYLDDRGEYKVEITFLNGRRKPRGRKIIRKGP